MDYGVEVPSYRRIDNEKKTKKINFENGLLGLLIVLFSGVMISRVGFGFVEGFFCIWYKGCIENNRKSIKKVRYTSGKTNKSR